MSRWRKSARRTIAIERAALEKLESSLDSEFDDACELLLACQGRVIVTGMGKSGHIAKKIAATLASTGTPAFFIHPGEASHGDLGMIRSEDQIIAISYSGEASEILAITPSLRRQDVKLIALTGNTNSSLAKAAEVNLSIAVDEEACPLGLAPTASTTATLALGDAIAVALLERRGFTEAQFALSHPAGQLGKRLLLRAGDLMQQPAPQADGSTALTQALLQMSEARLGCIFVTKDTKVRGIFTDGDLRRQLISGRSIEGTTLSEVATANPQLIAATTLAIDALTMMQKNGISVLGVQDNDQLMGALSLHELIRAGL